MALNSFHKYVSAIRKSKSFKPVIQTYPISGDVWRVVAKCKDTRYAFGPTLIQEIQSIIGEGLVISSEFDTNEMVAYDFWVY
jgi:hypothetical protein